MTEVILAALIPMVGVLTALLAVWSERAGARHA